MPAAQPVEHGVGVVDDLLLGLADEVALEAVAAEELGEHLVAVVLGVERLVPLAEFAALPAVVVENPLRPAGRRAVPCCAGRGPCARPPPPPSPRRARAAPRPGTPRPPARTVRSRRGASRARRGPPGDRCTSSRVAARRGRRTRPATAPRSLSPAVSTGFCHAVGQRLARTVDRLAALLAADFLGVELAGELDQFAIDRR